MKRLTVFFTLILFATTNAAIAGIFDQMAPSQIIALPQLTLEKYFLKEFCPNVLCDFGYHTRSPYPLTKAQKLSIYNYTLGYFQALTPALYNDQLSNSQLAFARVLDSALMKIPSEELTVYRGTSKKFLAKQGVVVEFKAYTSTSLDRTVAEGFAVDRLLILKVKSGKNIESFSNAGNEREILIPRGIKFIVEGTSHEKILAETEEGLKNITVEVVKLKELPLKKL